MSCCCCGGGGSGGGGGGGAVVCIFGFLLFFCFLFCIRKLSESEDLRKNGGSPLLSAVSNWVGRNKCGWLGVE